jgi:hypothetical protein
MSKTWRWKGRIRSGMLSEKYARMVSGSWSEPASSWLAPEMENRSSSVRSMRWT